MKYLFIVYLCLAALWVIGCFVYAAVKEHQRHGYVPWSTLVAWLFLQTVFFIGLPSAIFAVVVWVLGAL